MKQPELPVEDLSAILQATSLLWARARNARVFLTGGTGFFGSWLTESFHHANNAMGLNAKLIVLSRSPSRFLDTASHVASFDDVEFVQGDVTSFEFPPGRFDYIIHAATDADASLNIQNPIKMLTTIVDGTERIVELAQKSGARRLLFVSSGAVYGKMPPLAEGVTESYSGAPDPAAINAAYGEGKRCAELMCHIASRQTELETGVARCFAFVGPNLPLDGSFAIGNFIADALRGRPINVRGNGLPVRSYLYAGDLAIWLWTILFSGDPGATYNVGSDVHVRIKDLADIVRQVVNPGCQVEMHDKTAMDHGYDSYVPSIDFAKRSLNLGVNVGLEESILKTANWARKQSALNQQST